MTVAGLLSAGVRRFLRSSRQLQSRAIFDFALRSFFLGGLFFFERTTRHTIERIRSTELLQPGLAFDFVTPGCLADLRLQTIDDLIDLGCKAALKIDPPSASKNDPPEKGKKVSFCA